MYSVEDLLISHGYKLPQNTPASTPAPTPAPGAPSPSPPSYDGGRHSDCRREILENRLGHGPLNGFGWDGGPYGSRGYPPNDNECRDRNQPGSNHGDTQSLGDSITSDSGFCDGPRGVHPQSRAPRERDVAYWRRRGQDFSVLLDYADFREPRGGGGGGGYIRAEGQQQRGQEVPPEERQTERQIWANQAQVQAKAQAQAQARSREREAALHQWRMAAERKCQSLGTDEWRPASSFGRQMSDCEAEKWAREQMRNHSRTPDGAVLPRTKAKSQSLPRMLPPDSLQFVDMSGPNLYRRVNGHPGHPSHDPYGRRHFEIGRPASANQAAVTPKPRFSRPLRPPSYEVHQQTRGSCEMLSGDSPAPQARDRTPIPNPRIGDPRLDYFAQELGGSGVEPPGYIPPPSYKRAPVLRGGHRGPFGELPVGYRYRGEVVYQQVAPDGVHWYTRHPGGSWPDPQREWANLASRRKLYPSYSPQPPGVVQYIPFDDPRVRHISASTSGNSLTDADKIRHICTTELPSVTVSEPPPSSSSDNSAFPPLGHRASPGPQPSPPSPGTHDGNQNRWPHGDLHKDTDNNNFPATDQNCNRYPKGPSSAFQPAPPSRQGSCSDQAFSETATVTQVKKIVPDSGPDGRNSKRRVSETIFCLVSVPIQIQAKAPADQNNNSTALSLGGGDTAEPVASRSPNSQSLRSQSLTEMSLKPHPLPNISTSSSYCVRNSKRAPLRKEIVDAWSLQAMADKELCYAGSWPGDQYRNQETQTISPPVVAKHSPQCPPGAGSAEPGEPASSETTADGGMETEGSAYGSYSMAGQKNLHPSSNSAFSRLSLSPAQPLSLPPAGTSHIPPLPSSSSGHTQSLPPLSSRPVGGAEQLSSPKRSGPKPADDSSSEQVAFGQFLLKPVNRRPCDAIEELEFINKEMEEQIGKRPSTEPCLRDQEEAFQTTLELSQAGGSRHAATADPVRETAGLAEQSQNRPSHGEARSAFSRPATGRTPPTVSSRPPREDMPSHPGPRDYAPLLQREPGRAYRQDIPVAQESLLRDVGLTVYTEAPGGPGEPRQRSPLPFSLSHSPLSLPLSSLSEPQEGPPSLHMSWESRLSVVKSHSLDVRDSSEPEPSSQMVEEVRAAERTIPTLNLQRARSETSRPPRAEGSPCTARLSRELAFTQEDEEDARYSVCQEAPGWEDEATLADKHLESLLIQEKANALPAEDLSNLYEVKCAKGIPENESIEQRAARILGIAVPVEALGTNDAQDEEEGQETTSLDQGAGSEQGEPGITNPDSEGYPGDSEDISSLDKDTDKEMQQVSRQSEQVTAESLEEHGQQTVEEEGGEEEAGNNEDDSEDKHEEESQLETEDIIQLLSGGERNSLVLDLPEFPPSKLPLSLPVTPDQELALSVGRGEEASPGMTGDLAEDEQASTTSTSSLSSCSVVSPGRTVVEVSAQVEQRESESYVSSVGIRKSDSGGEGQGGGDEDGKGEVEEGEAEGELRGGEKEGEKNEHEVWREEEEKMDKEDGGDQEEEGEKDGESEGVAVGEHQGCEDREERMTPSEEREPEGEQEDTIHCASLEKDGGRKEGSTQEREKEGELGGEERKPQAGKESDHEDEGRVQPDAAHTTEQEEEELKIEEEVELKIAEEEVEKEVELNLAEEEVEKEVELKIAEEEAEKEVDMNLTEEEKGGELKIEEKDKIEKEVELLIVAEEVKKLAVESEKGQTESEMYRVEEVRRKERKEETEGRPTPLPRPQKPPLLPKPKPQPRPRSSATVAKREISLPLSFNVTCGSTTLEDEDLLSVSDSYDPSRVERV